MSSYASLVTSTVTDMVPMATSTAPSAPNVSQVIAAQAATQISMDVAAPRDLLLACTALVVLCAALAHHRFLARLFASASPTRSTQAERVVGGGDLRQGWVLRRRCDFIASQPLSPPPHIVPVLAHVPFTSSLYAAPLAWLPQPFASRLTLAPLYLIIGYLLFVAFTLVWRSDLNPTTKVSGYGYDFARTGFVATSQIPVVIALGMRGNVVGLCVGKGYEKLKVFHKLVGRVIFLAATVHAAAFFRKWSAAGMTATYSAKPFVVAGIVAWVSVIVIAVSSLPWCRRYAYKTFEVCHIVGVLGLLVGLAFHVDEAIPYCVAAAALYAVSVVASLTKTHLAQAEMTALQGSQTTIIRVPSLTTGWRAGQHVRLRIPGLGRKALFEAHPFTIASAPDGEVGLVLMCKVAGDWTRTLHTMVSHAANVEDSHVRMTVVLEGPFGGLGNTLAPSFSSVVLVAGGSGISHALALAHDLIQRAPSGVVRARTVDVVWLVRTEAAARDIMPTLVGLADDARAAEHAARDAQRALPAALRVTVHVTRCPTSSPLTLLPCDEKDHTSSPVDSSKPLSSVRAMPGRPDLVQAIHGIVDETLGRMGRDMNQPQGVLVTACGPTSMVDSVRDAVRCVPTWKRRAVGNVELEEEYFGF